MQAAAPKNLTGRLLPPHQDQSPLPPKGWESLKAGGGRVRALGTGRRARSVRRVNLPSLPRVRAPPKITERFRHPGQGRPGFGPKRIPAMRALSHRGFRKSLFS
jgi:hypothetical protein